MPLSGDFEPKSSPTVHDVAGDEKGEMTMRLSEFIHQSHKKIIKEWVKFAGTLLPWAKGVSAESLRDHAEELLTALVTDMQAPQSGDAQSEKSQGKASKGALAAVGHKHASQRLDTGFDLNQLVSEYRALRASILRLWAVEQGDKQGEVTRFNEAIDESLTEATVRYSEILDRTRDQFLAILGHDLRTPLSAIVMGASFLAKSESMNDHEARVAMRILSSAERMNRMVGDMLDLTRTRLGSGIPITPKMLDLATVCQHVISELEAIHSRAQLRFQSEGNLGGKWDSDRLHQLVSNLVANALQHVGEDGTVSVVAQAQDKEVVLRVHNGGAPIPASALRTIFEPMVRHPSNDGDKNSTGLGLGLFIVREIVAAHGGSIDVTSTEKDGTTFTVRVPRHPADKATPDQH